MCSTLVSNIKNQTQVQLGILRLGANHVVGLILKHYGLLKLAGFSTPVRSSDSNDVMVEKDFLVTMAEACIRLICTVATELPWKEDSNHIQIRREIVHALVAGERGVCTHSVLENCVGEGKRRKTSDDAMETVISDVAEKETTSSNTTVFRLKDECLKEYDPFFLHLRTQQHQQANQYVRERSKGKVLRHEPPSVSNAIFSFREIRGEILTSPVVLLLINTMLNRYIQIDGDSIALAATQWLSLTSFYLERECERRDIAVKFYIAFCKSKNSKEKTTTLDLFEQAKRHADKVGDSEVAETIRVLLRDLYRIEERWTGGLFRNYLKDLIGDDEKVEEEEKYKSAQQQAIAALAARQNQFAEMMMDMSSSSSEDEDEDEDEDLSLIHI